MVEQITDKEQLEQLIYEIQCSNLKAKGFWTMARLQPEVIEQWKREGYFRHIKSQLQNVHGIKFACSQDDDGACEYFFILPSRELKNRVYHMLNTLWVLKKKEPLVRCRTVYESNGNSRIEEVHGQVKACPLF